MAAQYLCDVDIAGVDFSNAATGFYFIKSANGFTRFVVRDCKLPTSWSGGLYNSYFSAGCRAEMYNCAADDTNYKIKIQDAFGTVNDDTSVYLDNGTTDGTTSLSYKFAANLYCNNSVGRFYGPEFVIWNETTGSSVTATVQIVHDGASAFKDNEVWLEVMYLGTSGYPQGTWTEDGVDPIASGSAQATSSETWTGDTGTGPNGSTTWNQLQLACSFTPQEKGLVVARVVMGIASKTIYVDPNVTLS